ncbi:MAG: AMP-binding protein, partial [Acidimicrobiales bacterium]
MGALRRDRGDQRAQVFGDQTTSWTEFNRRANGVAQTMIDAGVKKQGKSAQYMYNSPPYMESVFASFKASLVPVNTNYRYADGTYLLTDAKATGIVVHSRFAPTLASILADLPDLRVIIQVPDDSNGALLPGAEWYEDVLAAASPARPDVEWSPDDLYILYTGGTTGMPKGVMWDQNTLIEVTTKTHPMPLGPDADIEAWKEVTRQIGELAPVM